MIKHWYLEFIFKIRLTLNTKLKLQQNYVLWNLAQSLGKSKWEQNFSLKLCQKPNWNEIFPKIIEIIEIIHNKEICAKL